MSLSIHKRCIDTLYSTHYTADSTIMPINSTHYNTLHRTKQIPYLDQLRYPSSIATPHTIHLGDSKQWKQLSDIKEIRETLMEENKHIRTREMSNNEHFHLTDIFIIEKC